MVEPNAALYLSTKASDNITVDVTIVGLISSRENKIYNFLHFLALVRKKCMAESSRYQHAMPREFGGEWNNLCYFFSAPP